MLDSEEFLQSIIKILKKNYVVFTKSKKHWILAKIEKDFLKETNPAVSYSTFPYHILNPALTGRH